MCASYGFSRPGAQFIVPFTQPGNPYINKPVRRVDLFSVCAPSIRQSQACCVVFCKTRDEQAPFFSTRTSKERELENPEFAEMAGNGKLKASEHAKDKVAKPLHEEEHGYEFLGP
jgi:hypothetical protein